MENDDSNASEMALSTYGIVERIAGVDPIVACKMARLSRTIRAAVAPSVANHRKVLEGFAREIVEKVGRIVSEHNASPFDSDNDDAWENRLAIDDRWCYDEREREVDYVELMIDAWSKWKVAGGAHWHRLMRMVIGRSPKSFRAVARSFTAESIASVGPADGPGFARIEPLVGDRSEAYHVRLFCAQLDFRRAENITLCDVHFDACARPGRHVRVYRLPIAGVVAGRERSPILAVSLEDPVSYRKHRRAGVVVDYARELQGFVEANPQGSIVAFSVDDSRGEFKHITLFPSDRPEEFVKVCLGWAAGRSDVYDEIRLTSRRRLRACRARISGDSFTAEACGIPTTRVRILDLVLAAYSDGEVLAGYTLDASDGRVLDLQIESEPEDEDEEEDDAMDEDATGEACSEDGTDSMDEDAAAERDQEALNLP